ncbi:MAG: response regulator [Candidatus Omnitrophica bacterium]|nr:response regulator [Candidatus Omnitrophota bacterium]
MEKIAILVVDDEKEICRLTQSFLAKRDYAVFTATDGAAAVELTKKERPRLVLLDVRLDNESGMEVLRRIKEVDKNIKVIMVTALDDEESIRQAKSLGADDYIAKPFTAAYLNDLLLQKLSGLGLPQK